MTQKSMLDRIQDSLETSGAGLEEQVKRQYSHECGHMGMAASSGLVTGDGVAIADQILRETIALDGWRIADATARCEAIKRSFYLSWRSAFGLAGEPDSRPFGQGCCGFARAMSELIPGFPAEDSVHRGEGFHMKEMAEELKQALRRPDNDKEAALDQPNHLFFFGAVDGDGRNRFFDVMDQGHEFSLAETATSAPRLVPCIETAYENASGVRHHVHRNYGQIRTETARQAIEQFAAQTTLTSVVQLAETLTPREAFPVWKVIFEKLGCEPVAFRLETVTDYRTDSQVERVQADTPVDRSTAKIPMKTCPHCQREVLTLITDHATSKRYCYHCIPNPETCPGEVFIARKMDQLHAAGKLETYSLEQRLKDLKEPPRCGCGAVFDVLDSELCSKCEGEVSRLAHRIHQRRTPDHSVNTVENPATSRIKGDVGPEVVDFVFRELRIDGEWSTRDERGFTWWGHRLAQRVWADPPLVEDGDEIVRAHAEADVLRNVPDGPKTAQALDVLNTGASLGAFVWDATSRNIRLRCSAFFHAENFYWLSKLFLSAVSIQAAEAHRQCIALAKVFGAELDESAPRRSGPRPDADEMLDVIPMIVEQGTTRAALTAADFQSAVATSGGPWVMANADQNGLTAEFPFPGCMPPTTLLRVHNDHQHPILGRGLLILLRLPVTCVTADADILCAKLNAAEAKELTRCHFMGAWCTDSGDDLFQQGIMLTGVAVPAPNTPKIETGLTFCSFLPAALYQNGLLTLMIYGMAHRARWANEYLSSKKGMPELFSRRDPEAYNRQVETHSSLIKRILKLAVQQCQKKPN